MKLKFDIDNLGISIGIERKGPPSKESIELTPAKQTLLDAPGFYVYGHYDLNGSLFYVGKGIGKRAWSKDRHPLWERYVNNHLFGKYEVRIIADSMNSKEAEKLEATLIARHCDSLVNWQNIGRQIDFKQLEYYHALRNANRRLIQETKSLESSDAGLAAERYERAIEKTAEYAFLDLEKGLVGQLLQEEANELGRNGELEALDRLTLCLIKLGKSTEAANITATYFSRFKRDKLLKSSEKIIKRIEKGLHRSRKNA